MQKNKASYRGKNFTCKIKDDIVNCGGDNVSKTILNLTIGNQLRKLRGSRTQKKYVDSLDLLSSMSRSYYSMIEVGERPASLELLDMVASEESVSYDFLFGIHDNKFNPTDYKYQELINLWTSIDERKKNIVLNYIKKIAKEDI